MAFRNKQKKGPVTLMHKIMAIVLALFIGFIFGFALGKVFNSTAIGIIIGILACAGMGFMFYKLFSLAMAPYKNAEQRPSIQEQLNEIEKDAKSSPPRD